MKADIHIHYNYGIFFWGGGIGGEEGGCQISQLCHKFAPLISQIALNYLEQGIII